MFEVKIIKHNTLFNFLGKRSVGGSDMEPGKLWVDLGLLVVESRLPSESDKGWREGPHCPTKTSGSSHLCESNNFLVRKQHQFIFICLVK